VPKKISENIKKLNDEMPEIVEKYNSSEDCIQLSTKIFIKDSSYQSVCQIPFCALITPFCERDFVTADFRKNLIPRC